VDTLQRAVYEPLADCSCRRCGHRRALHLSPEQALRLARDERRQLDPTPRPEEMLRVFI